MKSIISRRVFLRSGASLGLGLGLMPSTVFASVPSLNSGSRLLSPSRDLKKGENQIFVDSEMIARTQNLERKVHPAKKLEHPVLEANMPWEQGDDYNGRKDRRIYVYGTVMHNPNNGEFQMWYNRLKSNCYATSSDGIHWYRPNFGELGENNKINLYHFHSPSIIKDVFETDPEKRYKAVGSVKSSISEEDIQYLKTRFKKYNWYNRSSAYSAAYSADGINWKLYPHPIILGGDTITLSQDPVTGEYLAFHKNKSNPDDRHRKVFLSTSKNMQDWTTPELVMEADETDHQRAQLLDGGTHAEIYNMSAFPYGGQWLGLITLFRRTGSPKIKGPGQSGHDGPIDVQLVHSRDGRNWKHCTDRTPVIGLGPYTYDKGSILGVCNTPVIVGDEMWMYYTAMTTTHGGYLPDKQMSIARAAWRMDGMVSLNAGKTEGIIETSLLKPEGNRLFVNSNVKEDNLRVEVLDSENRILPGLGKEECNIKNESLVKQMVSWGKTVELPKGKPIRLRFYLKDGDLFSYVVE